MAGRPARRAAVVLSLVSAQPRAGARDGTPPAAGRGFVGAWRRTATPFGASQSLVTFGADGTVLEGWRS